MSKSPSGFAIACWGLSSLVAFGLVIACLVHRHNPMGVCHHSLPSDLLLLVYINPGGGRVLITHRLKPTGLVIAYLSQTHSGSSSLTALSPLCVPMFIAKSSWGFVISLCLQARHRLYINPCGFLIAHRLKPTGLVIAHCLKPTGADHLWGLSSFLTSGL